jgi:hypothetical protein
MSGIWMSRLRPNSAPSVSMAATTAVPDKVLSLP